MYNNKLPLQDMNYFLNSCWCTSS